MKKFSIFALSVIAVLSLSGNVMAADDTIGVYVAATGGVSLPHNMTTAIDDTDPEGGEVTLDSRLKTGWLAGAKVGWQTPFTKRWLALEVEYNHIENSFDTGTNYQILTETLNVDSKVKLDLFMLNLIGRYPAGRIHPFIGIGGGYARVQLDDIVGINLNPSPGALRYANLTGGSKWVFAYQAMAGCDFDITKNLFLGIAYKYIVANKAQFDTTMASPLEPGIENSPGTVEAQYRSHNIVLTVGYLF